MDIDAGCLYDSRLENVERLAVALGVDLPRKLLRSRDAYGRELVRLVLARLRRDRERADRASALERRVERRISFRR